jgi:hypothetical protein
MIQGFFLDRINTETTGTPITGQDNLVIFIGSNKAQTSLAFLEFAVSRTEVTLHTSIIQRMPVLGWYGANILEFAHLFLTSNLL